MLQCVAVRCNVLQFTPNKFCHDALVSLVKCSVLQCVVVCCSALQCVVVCCSALQSIPNKLWYDAFEDVFILRVACM